MDAPLAGGNIRAVVVRAALRADVGIGRATLACNHSENHRGVGNTEVPELLGLQSHAVHKDIGKHAHQSNPAIMLA